MSVIIPDKDAPTEVTIKRPNTKHISHKSKFLLDGANLIGIFGKTGSGKSTVLLQILPMFSNKTKTIILASIKNDDVYDAIRDYCAEMKINYIKTSNEEETMNALNDLVEKKSKDEHAIFIADDFAVASSETSKKEGSAMNIVTIASKILRSYEISMIFVSQTYYAYPTQLRENLNIKIVFQMCNHYSVDSFVSDESGRYYDGTNDTTVKSDIKAIYRRVFENPHDFIVCLSNPNQIRFKWQEIIYPPDVTGKIVGGAKKRVLTPQIKERHELYKQAVELGYPRWRHTIASVDELKKFITVASAHAQKKIGNTAPEIDEIIGGEYNTPERMKKILIYNIRKFKRTQNPNNLAKVTEIANRLVTDDHISMQQMKYIIHRNGLDEYIDF